MFTVAMA